MRINQASFVQYKIKLYFPIDNFADLSIYYVIILNLRRKVKKVIEG